MVGRSFADRLATMEAAILRPPIETLTDAELQDRIDGYLARMVGASDPEIAEVARVMQVAPDRPNASRRLLEVLRASLARETH